MPAKKTPISHPSSDSDFSHLSGFDQVLVVNKKCGYLFAIEEKEEENRRINVAKEWIALEKWKQELKPADPWWHRLAGGWGADTEPPIGVL